MKANSTVHRNMVVGGCLDWAVGSSLGVAEGHLEG